MYKSFTTLIRFIPKYLILGAIVNGIAFLIYFSDYSLLVCRNTPDFHALILYSAPAEFISLALLAFWQILCDFLSWVFLVIVYILFWLYVVYSHLGLVNVLSFYRFFSWDTLCTCHLFIFPLFFLLMSVYLKRLFFVSFRVQHFSFFSLILILCFHRDICSLFFGIGKIWDLSYFPHFLQCFDVSLMCYALPAS